MWYGTERWKGGAADGAAYKLAYATSADGIRWIKPKLGLFQVGGNSENNFVTPEMEAFNCTIIKDNSDVRARRYKMIFSTGGRDPDWARFHSPLSVAYSHDGLRWERPRHVNPVLRGVSDDIWSFFFDPDRRKYLLLTRRVPNAPRDVSQYESFDLVNWEDKGRVLVAGDARDPIDVGTEIYYLSPFRYEDLYLGALNCLYTHPVSETYGSFHRSPGYPGDRMGLMDIQLAYSRDGRTWTRPTDRSPIVPIGKPGELDQGMVYSALNPIVRAGDTWIYYTGNRWSHNWWEWLDAYDAQRGIRDIASVMLARMPEDHFVSLDAGDAEGWFQSKPWGPPSEIFVNADAQGGSIQVELVTPYGEVIPDFGRSECLPITSSGRNQKIQWRSGRQPWDLRSNHRGGISARFYLRHARLYSYTMTLPDPDGKLARDKANARWLEAIKHRSDNWSGKSNDPAPGLPPRPAP
ncbi:MAG: hypothetical protein DMG07_13085 [Acidobacteria bacterium]|nr:MAG: hypothetical protein DMG07_13085 [Acidobacteriota bacterium]